MERLKHMKDCLIACAEGQMGQLRETDTKELGEVIDMIKDLDEAIYYCTITEAMENKYENRTQQPRMYYEDGYMSAMGRRGGPASTQSKGYDMWSGDQYRNSSDARRDYREGRSPMMRKNYMESKELHKDKDVQMKELDKYMQELSNDVTELIHDASPEEKQMLKHKIQMLSEKMDNA